MAFQLLDMAKDAHAYCRFHCGLEVSRRDGSNDDDMRLQMIAALIGISLRYNLAIVDEIFNHQGNSVVLASASFQYACRDRPAP